jgi:HPt (histidine-containing phosphotransfer) domain-containing protein
MAAAQSSKEVLAVLSGQDGIDVDAGLAVVGGNPDTYRHLLQAFVDIHGQQGSELLRLQQAGEWDALAALAHQIRGTVMMLGLIDVEGAAKMVQRAAEASLAQAPADPRLAAHTRALDDALTQVLSRLRSALQV